MTVLRNPSPGVPDESPTVDRYLWEPRALAPLDPGPSPRLRGKRVLLLAGRDPADLEAARGLRRRLEAAGASVTEEVPRSEAEAPDGIVDLAPLTPLTRLDPGDPGRHWNERFLRTMAALRACTPSWSGTADPQRHFYLAVTSLDGGFGRWGDAGAGQPYGGLWSGLAKTLHREVPNANVRVLDIAPQDRAGLAGLVVRELYRWGLFEIGYRGGRRSTLAPAAEPPAAAAWSPPSGSVVLLSGGGRGIGALLARTLAERHGCRVVVTGRRPRPDPADPWVDQDEAAFARWSRGLWGQDAPARVRQRIRTMKDQRELFQGLELARTRGIEVEYAQCDIRDRDQVRALVQRLGPHLVGVVHNAGVDRAVRLAAKEDQAITDTVATKIDGFVHLFSAVRTLPLSFFCNVGSLSGRMGGMVGQIDYAAANECLTWLGLWADAHAPFPVMTLAWPTWERTGLVANHEAAVRYMTALDPKEGVERWLAEIHARSRGEVSFIGRLGDQLTPVLAHGFPCPPLLAGQEALLPMILHLGAPQSYRQGESMVSEVRLDPGTTPALGDTEIDGRPALPVSLLLEDAVSSSAWVLPPHAVRSSRPVLEQVAVRVDLLPAEQGLVELRRSSHARRQPDGWEVEQLYQVRRGLRWIPLARLRVIHPADAADAAPASRGRPVPAPAARAGGPPGPDGPDGRSEGRTAGSALRWRWHGMVFAPAVWAPGPGARAEVVECRAADVWTLPLVAEPALPLAALEALLGRVASERPVPAGSALTLSVDRIEILGVPGARSLVTGDEVDGIWQIASAGADGGPVLAVDRIALGSVPVPAPLIPLPAENRRTA